MIDNHQPIKDYHVAFARAVVALARDHGVGSVKMQFRRASSLAFTNEQWDATEVSLVWHEGRHGDKAPLELKLEARAEGRYSEVE
ncbi:hypothetical protein ACQKO5_18955 [Novosphingobium subterraneum]|uniref:hypothetical protein n=1 Tax=Novosphingobium subterraneum TaxID=48936 RepID=UPI003D05D214